MTKIIDSRISNIKYLSFYIDKKLNCKFLIFFIKINELWYEISSGDGVSKISSIEGNPENKSWNYEGVEYVYILNDFNEIDLTKYGKLIKIEEYLYKGFKDESCGFLLSFDDGKKISIEENDDCLSIRTDEQGSLPYECVLAEYLINN